MSDMEETDNYFDRIHIADEIHDYIEIPTKIKRIIDTPEFQRLRELKQLGAAYYVFPGASHNRFEHSLGVMHLARTLLLHLKNHQPELKVTENELFCVSAAGLLHDLGHGPFSHVFDHQFVPSMIHKKFRHEDMSIALIKKLFADNEIKIEQRSLDLICALVSPSTHKHIVDEYKKAKRGFLFEIIANDINGIDVDKFDYFLRDSHNLSLDISFKHHRLLTHCRVINDHICFHDKTCYDVVLLFNTRYDLFKRIYSHKTSKAVEYMLCDVMRFSNHHFKITEKIQTAAAFMELTDNIIHRIQWQPNPDNDEGLEKAKQIITRIHRRNLYKCVGYLLLESSIVIKHFRSLPQSNDDNKNQMEMSDDDDDSKNYNNSANTKIDYHLVEKCWKEEIYEILKEELEDFKGYQYKLEMDGILLQLMSLSYGLESKHPIQNVYFYNSRDPNKSHLADMPQISQLHDASKFREVIFRVYVKDKRFADEVEMAFKIFCEKKKLVIPDQLKRTTSLGLSPKTARSESPKPVIDKKGRNGHSGVKRNLNDTFNEERSRSPSPIQSSKKRKLNHDKK